MLLCFVTQVYLFCNTQILLLVISLILFIITYFKCRRIFTYTSNEEPKKALPLSKSLTSNPPNDVKILNTEKENETDIGVHEATRNTIWDYGTRGITKARQFYGLTIEKTLRCCILHKHILHKKSSGDSHHVTVIWCLLLCSVNGNRFYQHIFYTWPITFNK